MKVNGIGPWLLTGIVAAGTFLFFKGTLRLLGFAAAGILGFLALTGKRG